MNNKALRSSSLSAALCFLAAGAIACTKPAPPVDKEPPAPSAVTVAPTASAAKAVEAPPIPVLAPEEFAPEGASLSSLHAVEGALMVVAGYRVGRIVDEGIEWIKKEVPSESPGLGAHIISSVVGRWPDSIGVLHSTYNGRAPQPTYFPLTGIGLQYTPSPGSHGPIYGVARLGESTVVAGGPYSGTELKTVRGAVVRKMQTPTQGGCKDEEVRRSKFDPEGTAITPVIIGSSTEGTLMSIGNLCKERGPAAEIWDKTGKSRIVDLSPWWKKLSPWPQILKGTGDELWLVSDMWTSILHYRNGEFEVVPDLERLFKNVFVSPRGQLHTNDGRTIRRYEGGKWIPVAQLAAPESYSTMAMDDKETIWVAGSGVHRLRPTPTPVAHVAEACATPFVYLYQISYNNEPKFTYPSTRKALSTFAEVAAIGLVEFEDDSRKRLGITVSSKAQGEAVIAHLKETMKDEAPRLICFEPQKDVRKIDMNAKK